MPHKQMDANTPNVHITHTHTHRYINTWNNVLRLRLYQIHILPKQLTLARGREGKGLSQKGTCSFRFQSLQTLQKILQTCHLLTSPIYKPTMSQEENDRWKQQAIEMEQSEIHPFCIRVPGTTPLVYIHAYACIHVDADISAVEDIWLNPHLSVTRKYQPQQIIKK